MPPTAVWQDASAIVLLGVVAIVGACSRSASNSQRPKSTDQKSVAGTAASASEPGPEHVATSEEERAILTSFEAKIRERDPGIDVVAEETVERGGQNLTQYRMGSPSFKARLPARLDVPTLIMYTGVEVRAGSSSGATALMDAVGKAMDLVPDLMHHGQIAIEPLAIWFAVKPGGKTRSWVSGLVQPLLIHDRDRLLHELGTIAVPEVKQPIVIGIVFPLDGQSVNAFDLPMPHDWVAAMAQAAPKQLLFPEELFAIVWPD